uniref:transposase family protein n=3 Tax=Escherichia coli TaxID=562 RepID=UPI000AA023EE
MELKKLMEHISIIPDYRQAWKVEHKLSDILLLTICAVISGAEGWEDIEDFGETHLDFLKQYGDFENGIPVHDTIARVVCKRLVRTVLIFTESSDQLSRATDRVPGLPASPGY